RFNPARRITAYRPFTSVPATITTTSTSTQTPTTASNVNYHLEGFEWTSSMLNSSTGALTVLGENGTQVILQLATDVDMAHLIKSGKPSPINRVTLRRACKNIL
ncbi:jg10320, partial [Pararge aegeria aegeria]